MNIKEAIGRFRAWQKTPDYHWGKGASAHQCVNCGHEYTGNYCPMCGQKDGAKRITWVSLWRNFMMIWGMDSHSLPVSLWQLIWRPGYFIGDYLDGHRQVSYPPVKMLFIVAVIYAILVQTFRMLNGDAPPLDESVSVLEPVFRWMGDNPAWTALGMTFVMTLPTSILFHFSPRHAHHSLPEGFFIQVFMSSLMLMSIFVMKLISRWLMLLVPLFYYVCYRQLFGYGMWSTLWRVTLCFATWLGITLFFFFTMVPLFDTAMLKNGEALETVLTLAVILVMLVIGLAVVLGFGYWISKKTCKSRES